MADEEVGFVGRAWEAVQRLAGRCSANMDIEELKGAVQLANDRIGKVLIGGQLLQSKSGVFDKLTKANEGLGAIGEGLEKAQDICNNVVAMGKILQAVKDLRDERIIYDNPDKAAEAFDTLFQGFGMICAELPSPAKEWATFFENFNLFGNMQKKVFKPYFNARFDAMNQTGQYQRN